MSPNLHSDIDECSTNSHRCDVNAKCNNNEGSHSCVCRDGYKGDGERYTGALNKTCNSGIILNNFLRLSEDTLFELIKFINNS